VRNSRLKLQEWVPHRLVKLVAKQQHNKLCRHSNRVLPPYSKLKYLVVVLHNRLWASKHN
jgi:hypothetical protein